TRQRARASELRLQVYRELRLRREVGIARKRLDPVARFGRKDLEAILSLLVAAEVRSVNSRYHRAGLHRILDLGACEIFAQVLPESVLDLHLAVPPVDRDHIVVIVLDLDRDLAAGVGTRGEEERAEECEWGG